VRGDFNPDRAVTNVDIQAMLDALVDLDGYRAAHDMIERTPAVGG
jgi:hypothetical protein